MQFKQTLVIASSQHQDENYNITTNYETQDDGTVIASRFINSKLYTLNFADVNTVSHLAKLTNNITSISNDSFRLLSGQDD